jgi:hypothetical protein
MIRCRTKVQTEDEAPLVSERTHLLAAETVLDTGEGFKIIIYLDSNGDWSIKLDSTNPKQAELFHAGNWRRQV